jgi:hypothetical protein
MIKAIGFMELGPLAGRADDHHSLGQHVLFLLLR